MRSARSDGCPCPSSERTCRRSCSCLARLVVVSPHTSGPRAQGQGTALDCVPCSQLRLTNTAPMTQMPQPKPGIHLTTSYATRPGRTSERTNERTVSHDALRQASLDRALARYLGEELAAAQSALALSHAKECHLSVTHTHAR